LTGRIFDDRGNRMSPSFAVKNGVRYRYYVSSVLAQGRQDEAGSVRRVPAADIEAAVLEALRSHQPGAAELDSTELVQQQLERVVVRAGVLELSVSAESQTSAAVITVGWAAPPTLRRRSVAAPSSETPAVGPIRAEARARLLESIAKARAWLDEIVSRAETTSEIARREGRSERSVRMTLSLAFLAPEVVRAAVRGELQAGCGSAIFADAPLDWRAQREGAR
jgi:site-specific DNA recombinase